LNIFNIFSVFQLRDFFDILIIASLIYFILVLTKQTKSSFILFGFLLFFGLYLLSGKFNLKLTRQFFQSFFAFFIVIVAIVFQKEIRKFFELIPFFGGQVGVSAT